MATFLPYSCSEIKDFEFLLSALSSYWKLYGDNRSEDLGVSYKICIPTEKNTG